MQVTDRFDSAAYLDSLFQSPAKKASFDDFLDVNVYTDHRSMEPTQPAGSGTAEFVGMPGTCPEAPQLRGFTHDNLSQAPLSMIPVNELSSAFTPSYSSSLDQCLPMPGMATTAGSDGAAITSRRMRRVRNAKQHELNRAGQQQRCRFGEMERYSSLQKAKQVEKVRALEDDMAKLRVDNAALNRTVELQESEIRTQEQHLAHQQSHIRSLSLALSEQSTRLEAQSAQLNEQQALIHALQQRLSAQAEGGLAAVDLATIADKVSGNIRSALQGSSGQLPETLEQDIQRAVSVCCRDLLAAQPTHSAASMSAPIIPVPCC